MREILFRGKRKDNGEWVYGFYLNRGNLDHYIEVVDKNGYLVGVYRVIPETVGEYTGLTDKNGKKIFEGDIVKCDWCKAMSDATARERRFIVSFYDGGFKAFYLFGEHEVYVNLYQLGCIKVIGNVHDNFELL